ncbi:serine/threonine protein kinase OSK1-like [Telopea speciosissima]|uniref:serine/threonine protein kinase OSK1-like n=1 Tax=Telopea speciosissima TaxID=54955 RepID=UPI001CC3B635|nr:serine/threonine protein kinase OSK1-like [Telopea speciosissima]
MGFDRNQLVESLRNRKTNDGTVAYYLLLDNRFRVSSGYLGAEFQESMVCLLARIRCFNRFGLFIMNKAERRIVCGYQILYISMCITCHCGIHEWISRYRPGSEI